MFLIIVVQKLKIYNHGNKHACSKIKNYKVISICCIDTGSFINNCLILEDRK